MPFVDQVLAAFPESDRRNRRAREIASLLSAFLAAQTLRPRMDALVALARWVVLPDRRFPLPTGPAEEPAAEHRRLAALVRLLERIDLGPPVSLQLAAVMAEVEGVHLVAETGMPNDRGIYNETTDRLFRRLLPSPRDDHDLATLVGRMFPSPDELEWLEGLPPNLFVRLCEALAAEAAGLFGKLVAAVTDSFELLGARVQGLGLTEAIRARSRPLPVRSSPFLELQRAGGRFLERMDQPGPRVAAERGWRGAVDGCRAELKEVLGKLETTGISIDVVYGLEVIEHALWRLERLMDVLVAAPGPERVGAGSRLLVVLVRGRLSDRSLQSLAHANLHLLARKLIERAGKTGEHYITSGRREYWQMLGSAMGGGFLTLGTASLKVQVGLMHLAPFLEGVVSGTNYALSFIIMQMLGFTLATKQPSMTAATLAGAVGQSAGPERMDELVKQVARICRSQLAAALGNVSMVTVTAVAFDLVWRWRTGHAFLTPAKAADTFAMLHPLLSGTIFYGFITGIILWVSSLAAGWVENFAVYHRLPQALAEHRLGRWVGERTMRWVSEVFARNVSGYGGSVALGFMLGMTPVLGKFFGLPIDVRHVTLSTGTLALAVAQSGTAGLSNPALPAAIAGIGVIFVLNLGVSFMLALTVALRAREVPRRNRVALFAAILKRFLRSPREFLFPPRGEEAKAPAHAHGG